MENWKYKVRTGRPKYTNIPTNITLDAAPPLIMDLTKIPKSAWFSFDRLPLTLTPSPADPESFSGTSKVRNSLVPSGVRTSSSSSAFCWGDQHGIIEQHFFGNSLPPYSYQHSKLSAFYYNATIFSTVIMRRNVQKQCIFNHLQLMTRFRNILNLCLSASLSSKVIASHAITESAINTNSQASCYFISQKRALSEIFSYLKSYRIFKIPSSSTELCSLREKLSARKFNSKITCSLHFI